MEVALLKHFNIIEVDLRADDTKEAMAFAIPSFALLCKAKLIFE